MILSCCASHEKLKFKLASAEINSHHASRWMETMSDDYSSK